MRWPGMRSEYAYIPAGEDPGTTGRHQIGVSFSALPVLMVHGDGCVLPDNARRVYDALAGPKKLVWTEGSQTDFYDQREAVDEAIEAADRHFRETLR